MLDTIKRLPKNVWVLAATLSLAMASIPLLVLIGGLLGAALAPVPGWATLPLAFNVVGLAIAAIPASIIAKKIGRKMAGFLGMSISLTGVLLCALATIQNSFYLLLLGGFCIGMSVAFLQQFRFAAIESLRDPNDVGPALSVIMLCSIVAGILGPELGGLGKDLIPAAQPYTGSFLIMASVLVLAMLCFTAFKNPVLIEEHESGESRPLLTIVRQPVFLVSVSASLIGYAVMSFLMTSTPISMNVFAGHSLAESKWVIQSHLVAMFLPSLFSGYLIKRLGPALIMTAGAVLYLLVILVASLGQHVLHYWWALVMLGVGWNFLFMSGTTVLPRSYRHSERFKSQAVNDFSIFASQAFASLSAGWVLFKFGWLSQVLYCLPITVLMLFIAIYYLLSERRKPRQE